MEFTIKSHRGRERLRTPLRRDLLHPFGRQPQRAYPVVDQLLERERFKPHRFVYQDLAEPPSRVQGTEQLLHRNVQRFRGRLVFKTRRLV